MSLQKFGAAISARILDTVGVLKIYLLNFLVDSSSVDIGRTLKQK
jgi:hypothetical protein